MTFRGKSLLAAVCAAVLTACGAADAEPQENNMPETAPPVTSAEPAAADISLTEEDGAAAPDDDDDDEDEEDTFRMPDETQVTELTLDKEKLDPKKPLTPAESELGSGKEVTAYPLNSIMLTIYQAPSEKAKQTEQVIIGSRVTHYANAAFNTAEYWAYVGYEGKRGWCRANELTDTEVDWLYLDGIELPEKCFDYDDYNEGVTEVSGSAEIKASPSESTETVGTVTKGGEYRIFGETPSAKGWVFVTASAEYSAESPGTYGELYGWVKEK